MLSGYFDLISAGIKDQKKNVQSKTYPYGYYAGGPCEPEDM